MNQFRPGRVAVKMYSRVTPLLYTVCITMRACRRCSRLLMYKICLKAALWHQGVLDIHSQATAMPLLTLLFGQNKTVPMGVWNTVCKSCLKINSILWKEQTYFGVIDANMIGQLTYQSRY